MGRAHRPCSTVRGGLTRRYRAALDGSGQRAASPQTNAPAPPVDVQMEGKVRAQNVVPSRPAPHPGVAMRRRSTASGILRADVDVALVAAAASAAIIMPSMTEWGLPSMMERSINAPGSPSSPCRPHTSCLWAGGGRCPTFCPRESPRRRGRATGIEDLTADVLVGHLKERLFESGVAVVGKVFVNVLGVCRARSFPAPRAAAWRKRGSHCAWRTARH